MNELALEEGANAFVTQLNSVLEAALDTDVRFVLGLDVGRRQARIEASRSFERLAAFPLLRQSEDPGCPSLLLRARYIVELAGSEAYLRVVSSTVGLWVDVTGGRKNHRPLVRLEYDRYPEDQDRAAAHVHLHANSPEMAWVYGTNGRPAPDLHALHFPVGGKRFRPTFEDFLLFLDREKLYTGFKPNWKPAVLRSLEEWNGRQAAATAQRYPEKAARVLQRLGYSVSPPDNGGTG